MMWRKTIVRLMFLTIFMLAGLGLVVSVAQHARSLMGDPAVHSRSAYLHVLALAVLAMPTIWLERRRSGGGDSSSFFRDTFGAYEKVGKRAFLGLAIYAFLALLAAVVSKAISPGHQASPESSWRAISACAILCYVGTMVAMFPVVRSGQLWPLIKCPKGHDVPARDAQCPWCLRPVVPDGATRQ
jgi:hypothetical protein